MASERNLNKTRNADELGSTLAVVADLSVLVGIGKNRPTMLLRKRLSKQMAAGRAGGRVE